MFTLIKSSNDDRSYKHLKLSNGIKCLIISDPMNDTAAAALSLGAGGYDSPIDLPGLAHLLEHMLFFGSTTYPKENYYSEYITQHGGSSNAFTATNETTYHFNILDDHFEHALDIFSHFFIDPIFNKEMIDREINAVDSEFYTNYSNDHRKLNQVLYSLIDKEYPITNFSCGNKKTLCSPDLYDRMKDFFTKHYTPDKMCLVISSKGSINSLEKMVIDKFSNINDKNFSKSEEKIDKNTFENILPFDIFLNSSPHTPFIKIEPVKETHFFSMIWQLLSTIKKNKYIISFFWENIIDDEGVNSLYSYMKDNLYVTSIWANTSGNDNFDLFKISMHLTEHGNKNIWKITKIIRYYIEKLLNISDSDINRIYDETKKIFWINFNNKTKEDPESYVLDLVGRLRNYEEDDQILTGEYFTLKTNEHFVVELRKYMQTIFDTKPIIVHTSPMYRDILRQKEIYYDTGFEIEWIPDAWQTTNLNQDTILSDLLTDNHDNNNMSQEFKSINIPLPNQYIPNNFDLIENKEYEEIKKISSTKFGELWYKLDVEHKEPKINAFFSLLFGNNVLKNQIMFKIYTSILNDILNKKLYSSLSLYKFDLSYNDGIDIFVYGYSDKILNIWSCILEAMSDFKYDNTKFNQIIENLIKNYRNVKSRDTQQDLEAHINKLYYKNTIFCDNAIKYLESITINDLIEFEKHLYDNCYYIGLIQGNLTFEHSNKFKDIFHTFIDIKKTLPLEYVDFPNILNDPTFETKIYNHKPSNEKEINTNSSTATLFDLGQGHYSDDKNTLLNYIFTTIINESFYDKLRTKQQLGYIVQCSSSMYSFLDKENGVIKFTIQSSTYDNLHLQTQINEFIQNIFNSLDQKSFENCVESCLTKLKKPIRSLNQSFNYNFSRIFDRSFRFDSKNKKIELTKQLTYQDLLNYVTDNIVNNQRKIIININ